MAVNSYCVWRHDTLQTLLLNEAKMSNEVSANDVWQALNLRAPEASSKQRVTVNNRHNRTIRSNVIKLVLRSFASLNGDTKDTRSFGLVKATISNKHYYFAVCCKDGNDVTILQCKAYPTGIIDGMLENHWIENNRNAVGIILQGNKVLPIISNGSKLSVGAWKN